MGFMTGISHRISSYVRTQFKNVRVRLTAWYVFLLATILVGFSILVYVSMERSLYRDLDESLQAKADQIEAAIRIVPGGFSITAEGIDHPRLMGRTYAPPAPVSMPFVILDMSESIKASSGPSSKILPIGPDVIDPAIHGDSLIGTLKVGNRETLRFLSAPLEVNGKQVGVAVVGRSLYQLESTLTRLRLVLGSLIVGALILAGMSGYLMAWRALAPIDAITRAARKITAKDLGLRLNFQGVDDEVGRLARTFDEMLARLDEQFQRERQFTADVSHELRTPLSIIRSAADIVMRDPKPTLEGYRAALHSVRDEATRLSSIVDDLLFFARADFHQVRLNIAPIDMNSLMGDVFDYGVKLASPKGIDIDYTLESTGQENIVVNGDTAHLMRMFINLIDNAVKYTPPGGKVRIEVRSEDKLVHVIIADTGMGIPEEDIPRIFDRFYRGDSSRARTVSGNEADKASGVGLGLAIAKTIAELHGGSITVKSMPGEGSAFRVTMPRIVF